MPRQWKLCSPNFSQVFYSFVSCLLQCFLIEDAFSGLRQFLTTESPLKVMKSAFYFIFKTLFVLKIFKFLSCYFGHVEKRLD